MEPSVLPRDAAPPPADCVLVDVSPCGEENSAAGSPSKELPHINRNSHSSGKGDTNTTSVASASRKVFRDLIVDLLTSVHVPNILQGTSVGMRSSLIPIFCTEFGASDATSGLVTAMAGVGRMLSGLPGGKLTSRHGFTNVMVVGMLINVVGALIGAASWNSAALGVANLTWGIGIGGFYTARLVMLANVVDKSKRGRLMSIIGGGERWASVLGPTIGGLVIEYFGTRVCCLAVIPVVLLCVVCLLKSNRVRFLDEKFLIENRIRDGAAWSASPATANDTRTSPSMTPSSSTSPETVVTAATVPPHQQPSTSIRRMVREYSSLILGIGVYAMNLLQLRACRKLMLPLAALRLNLTPAMVGMVLSFSFAVDASLFFLGGLVMDRFGRKFSAVPTTINLGLSFLILSKANSTASLFFAAVMFGFADSLGSGLLLTMNADNAPKHVASEFMGLMRVIQDCGQLVGPLIAGAISNLVSFEWACVFFGALGLLNAVWAVLYLPSDAPQSIPSDENHSRSSEAPPHPSPQH